MTRDDLRHRRVDKRRRRAAAEPAEADPMVLSARQPSDLIGVVPYLLGFHPTESLVVVFLRNRQVAVTARVDLPATESFDGLVEHLELVAARVETRTVVILGYSADGRILQTLADLASVLPFDLVDALAVGPDRWWSVLCDGGCCPVDGTPYDLSSHPMAAAAVLAGLPTTATREEIAALTDGPDAGETDRLAQLARACETELAGLSSRRRKQRMRRGVQRALDTPAGPSETEAIELAVLAGDVTIRDVAWAMMTRPTADDHVTLWRRVVAVATPPYEAAPLGMLAMAGWISGNGALLNCCIDRLERVAPDYTLLGICRDISLGAIHPRYFDELSRDLKELAG